jgi:hypothetical protein
MSFFQLLNLYAAFMESNALRHQELVTPIMEYAKSIGTSASSVLADLKDLYIPTVQY